MKQQLLLIAALLAVTLFGVGFMVGRYYEQQQDYYINFQLNEHGLIIESRQDGEKERVRFR